MEKICIKVDIPSELREEFSIALDKVVKSFVNELQLSVVKEIVSKSQFNEKDAEELANKVKSEMKTNLNKKQ